MTARPAALLLALFLTTGPSPSAIAVTLYGQVYAYDQSRQPANTPQPVAGIQVVATPPGGTANDAHTVYTDRQGRYVFIGLAAGKYNLDFLLAGANLFHTSGIVVPGQLRPIYLKIPATAIRVRSF